MAADDASQTIPVKFMHIFMLGCATQTVCAIKYEDKSPGKYVIVWTHL